MPREDRDDQEQTDGWKRLLIALNDLAESKQYVEGYVAFTNKPACLDACGALLTASDALGLDMVRLVENALLSNGLIAYARPFTDSRGGKWTRVPGRFTSSFTREERRIHNYVLEARKKLIAHSDFKGVHTHSTQTENRTEILSVRPAPIVMIQGEDDSLDIDSAAKRSGASAETTFGQIQQLVQDVESDTGAFRLLLHENRLFDVDIKHCNALVGMIDKVDDAISEELGLNQASRS